MEFWLVGVDPGFEIRRSNARVYLDSGLIHLRESPKSKTTLVKHNCANLCNTVKEQITKQAWEISADTRISAFFISNSYEFFCLY